MTRLRPIPLLLLVACGALSPVPDAPLAVGMTPDEVDSPTEAAEPDWSFTPGEDWKPTVETWRIDLRSVALPGLPEAPWQAFERELAITILVEDPPLVDVRTGAVLPDSHPAAQDFCIPVSPRLGGHLDADGHLELALEDRDLPLGQPFPFDTLWLAGDREVELAVYATVPAAPFAAASFGSETEACATLESAGHPCGACTTLPGDCVKLKLEGAGVTLEDLLDLEPVTAGDVAANPACD